MAELPSALSVPPAELGTTTTVLRCTDLHRSFGSLKAVDGVSFRIGTSETYGLLGPNGAGKTTTISMVTGVLAADSGRVVVDDLAMAREHKPIALGDLADRGGVDTPPRAHRDLTPRRAHGAVRVRVLDVHLAQLLVDLRPHRVRLQQQLVRLRAQGPP